MSRNPVKIGRVLAAVASAVGATGVVIAVVIGVASVVGATGVVIAAVIGVVSVAAAAALAVIVTVIVGKRPFTQPAVAPHLIQLTIK